MTVYIDKNYYIDDMKPCEMTTACEAKRLYEPFVVESPHGLQHGNAGDFVLRTINGHYFICNQTDFYHNFQWMSQHCLQGGHYGTGQKIETKEHH